MSKYVHILIKPDAFLRNIVHEIIDSFHNYNFEIIAVNIIMPNKSLLDVMYDKEFKWEYDYYCHNKRLYGLGPSLSVIIKYNSNIDYKMIKGASLPIYPCMNSIRYLYGVKDRCLNLIHIADTLQESLNEINVIYGNILSEELRTDTFNLKKMLDFILSTLSNDELHYKQVIRNIEKRIVHKVNCILYFNGYSRIANDMNEAQLQLCHYKHVISENLRKILELGLKLSEIMENADTSKKIRFFDYLFNLFEKEMIYISDLEKYILMGQCYYKNVNL